MSLNIKTSTGRQVIASNGDVLVAGRDLNVYSSNETVIGYWTDGKPLYRKTYVFNLTIPQDSTERTTTYDANISALNIDFFGSEVLSIEGLNTNIFLRPNVLFLINRNGKVHYWQNASSNTNYKIAFSIVYTKTTDQPVTDTNSYSTEEKLTGETDWNGKPIWRKVIQSTTPSTSGQNLDITIDNADKIIHRDVCVEYASGYFNYANTYFSNSDYITSWIVSNTTIRTRCTYTSKPITLIVEYTKTT